MPNVECSIKVNVYKENCTNKEGLIKKEIFDKKMINFAKEVNGRNINIDQVTSETTVKINRKGIILKGLCSGVCVDGCFKAFKPLRMTLDKPFVYALIVGKTIVAFGMHNRR